MSEKNFLKTANKRTQIILKTLIEHYIQSGEPVGSKTLAEESGLPLSSATIRNVLAELEAQGYIHSPHPSAGRIPTDQGYRLFVDSLLTIQPLPPAVFKKAQKELTADLSVTDLLSKASALISAMTSLTGLVTIPRQKHIVLSHIEFLPLSDCRVLAVLVLNGREIQNRILYTDRNYAQSVLQQASNYLNRHFAGKPLSRLKKVLKAQMQADKKELNQLLQAAIDTSPPRQDFVLSGEVHLFDSDVLSDRSRLREIFEAFNQKRDILYLLDQCIDAEGVQLFIGKESGYAPLIEYSLVSAPYSIDEQVVGVLAIIGPTRMAYHHVIAAVDMTAKLLGAALNQIG